MPDNNAPYAEQVVAMISKGVLDGVISSTPENAEKINAVVSVLSEHAEETINQVQGVLVRADEVGERAALAFGSAVAIGNTGLAVGGGAILLTSGKNFLKANNKVARMFYALSIICSGTGTVSSTIDVYCAKCGLSKTGMLGDGFGGLFLYAGNKANDFGQVVEGKKTWRSVLFRRSQVKRPLPKFGGGYRGMSFVGNSANIGNIPYLEVISAGVTIYTTYRCVKLAYRCSKSIYKYVYKKFTPNYNPKHVVWYVSEYLVEYFSINQVHRIYDAALRLHYREVKISLFKTMII